MEKTSVNKKRLLLAAGGTGGHIWPALSFGEWIKERHPECEVSYVCGSRALELEIYRAAGVTPNVLPIEGSPLSGSSMRQRAKRISSLFASYSAAVRVLEDFRPDRALLFGGYLSFPMMAACGRRGVRCAMHEQNARAGKVTRIAAKFGVDIYSGWHECLPLPAKSYLRTGVPVRSFRLPPRGEAWKKLGLPGEAPDGTIVVAMTGSLGSEAVMDKLRDVSRTAPFDKWSFIAAAVSDETRREGENLWLLPKIWDAAPLFACADLLVLRGGGSTLTEAGTLGIPALVIPWKRAADNHQYYNAVSFAGENTALIYDENDGPQRLAQALRQLEATAEKGSGRLAGGGEAICENLWSAICTEL